MASVALAILVGVAASTLLVSRTFDLGPLTLVARPAVGLTGRTTLSVPPFGEASAETHAGPARLSMTVDSVDVPAVQRLIAREIDPEPGTILQQQAAVAEAAMPSVIENELEGLRGEIISLVVLTALAASAVACVVLLALRRRAVVLTIGAALAFLLVMGSAGVAAATFDPRNFASPKLEGALSYVPRLQTLFSARLSSIEQLRGQVSKVANDLAAYYADPRSIAAGGGLPGTFRVLNVSDLHMDPVGAQLASSLARSYDASLVIDTGDLGIAGSTQEAALLPSLVVTSAPVVFVPGNHDSALISQALDALPNVTVATTGTVMAEGLRIFPVPDPAGASPGVEPDRAAIRIATQRAARRIAEQQESGLPGPDIIALHNPVAERSLVGLAPVILSGHTHSGRLYRDATGIRLNPGTLGGMPYDPVVTGRDRLPHGASILYYTPELPRKLIAVDRISVGVDGTTTLNRTVIDSTLLP